MTGRKLDRSRPYGNVSPPTQGWHWYQDGLYFNAAGVAVARADGSSLATPPEVEVATVEPPAEPPVTPPVEAGPVDHNDLVDEPEVDWVDCWDAEEEARANEMRAKADAEDAEEQALANEIRAKADASADELNALLPEHLRSAPATQVKAYVRDLTSRVPTSRTNALELLRDHLEAEKSQLAQISEEAGS